MGNESSIKTLSNDDNDVPTKRRYLISSSLDNQANENAFIEDELIKLPNAYRCSSFNVSTGLRQGKQGFRRLRRLRQVSSA